MSMSPRDRVQIELQFDPPWQLILKLLTYFEMLSIFQR
jgi:hypothetical protein